MLLYFAGLIFYTIRRKNGGSKTKLRLSFENLLMLHSVFFGSNWFGFKNLYYPKTKTRSKNLRGGAKVKGLITQVKGRGAQEVARLRGLDLTPPQEHSKRVSWVRP